jgi:phosphatidylethanolamine/phosphatidyl-N-methylethanolamine N-methyltransferase
MRADPDAGQTSEIFRRLYDSTNYDGSLAAIFMRRCHRILERRFHKGEHFSNVIEVGAGTCQHIQHVQHGFDRYVVTDLDEEMLRMGRARLPERTRATVELSVQNARALSYADQSFDRLIATHVLEHLPDPADVLREWYRVVRPGGVLSIVLPCDPGMMWRFGRHLGPRRTARRAGLEYDYFMAREHINSIFNLVTLIRYYFESIDESWYPLMIPSANLNLFYICNIRRLEL